MLSNRRFCMVVLLACIHSGASAQPKPAPAAPPSVGQSVGQSVRLTPTAASRGDNGIFHFGSLDADRVVSHAFTLRNETAAPITLSHVQTTCGCLSLPGAAPLPTLKPGESFSLTIALDPAQIPERATLTRMGSEFSRQVWVYAKEEAVHPVAVLELRGRITEGAAFDPPQIGFGTVSANTGARRSVTVIVEAARYPVEGLKLTAGDDRLRMRLVDTGPVRPDGKRVCLFEAAVPPHSPSGPLNGVFTLEGSGGAAAGRAAFTGQIAGRIAAEPAMAVFGLIRASSGVTAAAARADALLRTRWVLLLAPQRPAAPRKAPGAARKGSAAPAFWSGADIASTSPVFAGALVPPASGRAAAWSAPPPLPEGVAPGSACWLRVTVQPSAPRGVPLAGTLQVRFADGERLRVPVMAQRE